MDGRAHTCTHTTDAELTSRTALNPQPSFDESNVATGFVPESEKSSFLSFVKKAMHGIDLSRITSVGRVRPPPPL